MGKATKTCPHCGLLISVALCPVLKVRCKHAKIESNFGSYCSISWARNTELNDMVCTKRI